MASTLYKIRLTLGTAPRRPIACQQRSGSLRSAGSFSAVSCPGDKGGTMRRALLTLGLLAVALAVSAFAVAASDDQLLPNEQHFLDSSGKTYDNGTKSGSALNMVAVGQNALGDRGFNGDVYVHKKIAYIGRWGFYDSSHPQFCPSGGVAVVDVHDPANPVQVANLEVPGASHEDVVVYTAKYGLLAGHDIAAVGLQVCDVFRKDPAAAGKRGLGLWDVTNPAAPTLLSVFDTGCCTRGFHELEVGDRADLGRTFAYASLPYAERPDSTATGVRDLAGHGEAWIVDVTDPAHPAFVSSFGIKKDLGLDPTAGQGCFAISFGHGMDPSDDGRTLFVSYWDAGFISLDISDPWHPHYLGRFTYAPNEDGDGHSTSYTTPATCSSPRTRTSARPGRASSPAGATCACSTKPTRRTRCRSARSTRRTRTGSPIRARATTSSTTRSWSALTSTSRGTRTGFASSARRTRATRKRSRTSFRRPRRTRSSPPSGTRSRTRPRSGASLMTRRRSSCTQAT